MPPPHADRRRVAVIGGGISGLAAAHRLLELAPEIDVVLVEAADHTGGVLRTERRDGFLIEQSADMFTTRDPWALELCRRIGFERELIETNAAFRGAYIIRRGRLVRVPQGFVLMRPTRVWPVLTSPLFSLRGKLRLAAEPFIRRRQDPGDESLASFARRRLGREAYENLVQPLIGGIYTADPERLSMQATMGQFVEMERQHGSLVRAAFRPGMRDASATGGATGARYGLFVAPRDGMTSLVDRVAGRLPAGSVRCNSPVRELARIGEQGWSVTVEGQAAERFDAVVVALPAHAAARLLSSVEGELAQRLADIAYAGVAVAIVGYRKAEVPRPLDAFGYVTPMVEGRRVLAGSFASLKFAGRAPEEQVLMRLFLGGACQSELVDLPEEEIRRIVCDELRELLGITAPPNLWHIIRWKNAMPQYHVGHLERIAEIEAMAARIANLELAGNAYRGVGIPFCVRSGEQAAERTVASLRANRTVA